MNNRSFPRNISENDIKALISQGQKKAEHINRIIDTDIVINMVSESNTPIKEKSKYLRNSYRRNNKNNFLEKNKNNINYHSRNDQGISNLKYNNINKEFNYNFNYDMNEELDNSLNLNKPFHHERRHFPLINNKGNFFKNITPFLVGTEERINLIRDQNNNNYNKFNNIQNAYKQNENNKKKYNEEKLNRSSSMGIIPINRSNIRYNLLKDINMNNDADNISYSMGNNLSRRYKYYNPYRNDYEGSRYGDNTYNYYLNSPMRSDISADWKFPPLYYYNYKLINEQKKNNSNN